MTQYKERSSYLKPMEDKLKMLDRKLEDLKEQVDNMDEKTRSAANDLMESIVTKRREALAKFEEIKMVSKDKWKTITSEMDRITDDLRQTIEETTQKFRK